MKFPSTAASQSPQPKPSTPRRPRGSSAGREAWITDPESLLHALEAAEQSARDAERRARVAREVALVEEVAPIAALVPPAPASVVALPTLRDDERLLRPVDREVVVIVRRRRAA